MKVLGYVLFALAVMVVLPGIAFDAGKKAGKREEIDREIAESQSVEYTVIGCDGNMITLDKPVPTSDGGSITFHAPTKRVPRP